MKILVTGLFLFTLTIALYFVDRPTYKFVKKSNYKELIKNKKFKNDLKLVVNKQIQLNTNANRYIASSQVKEALSDLNRNSYNKNLDGLKVKLSEYGHELNEFKEDELIGVGISASHDIEVNTISFDEQLVDFDSKEDIASISSQALEMKVAGYDDLESSYIAWTGNKDYSYTKESDSLYLKNLDSKLKHSNIEELKYRIE